MVVLPGIHHLHRPLFLESPVKNRTIQHALQRVNDTFFRWFLEFEPMDEERSMIGYTMSPCASYRGRQRNFLRRKP